jgi:hypothetical protein
MSNRSFARTHPYFDFFLRDQMFLSVLSENCCVLRAWVQRVRCFQSFFPSKECWIPVRTIKRNYPQRKFFCKRIPFLGQDPNCDLDCNEVSGLRANQPPAIWQSLAWFRCCLTSKEVRNRPAARRTIGPTSRSTICNSTGNICRAYNEAPVAALATYGQTASRGARRK